MSDHYNGTTHPLEAHLAPLKRFQLLRMTINLTLLSDTGIRRHPSPASLHREAHPLIPRSPHRDDAGNQRGDDQANDRAHRMSFQNRTTICVASPSQRECVAAIRHRQENRPILWFMNKQICTVAEIDYMSRW